MIGDAHLSATRGSAQADLLDDQPGIVEQPQSRDAGRLRLDCDDRRAKREEDLGSRADVRADIEAERPSSDELGEEATAVPCVLATT